MQRINTASIVLSFGKKIHCFVNLAVRHKFWARRGRLSKAPLLTSVLDIVLFHASV